MMDVIVSFFDGVYFIPVVAFAVMLVIVPLAVWCAHHLEFLDHPEGDEGRKQHEEAVPPIGGVLMFCVFLLALVVSGVDLMAQWAVVTALVLVVVTGAIDDRFHIEARIKFWIQVVASVLIIWPGGALVGGLGDMFGFGEVTLWPWFSYVFSFAAVLLLINSVNLVDGLDGLAGGICFVICGWLLFVALQEGRDDLAQMIMLLMAVLAGFLFYNMQSPFRSRALLFMGDAGSMGLGVMISFLAVYLGRQSEAEGLDHVQVLSPMSVRRAVFFMVMLWAVCGLLGLSTYFWDVPQVVLTLAWALVFGGYTLVSIRPARFQKAVSFFA